MQASCLRFKSLENLIAIFSDLSTLQFNNCLLPYFRLSFSTRPVLDFTYKFSDVVQVACEQFKQSDSGRK